MKPFAAVVAFLLIIGASTSVQAQTPSGAVVGPIYYASLYGVVGSPSTDDTSHLAALFTTIEHADAACSPNCGGTIQLPVTGNKTRIDGTLVIPPNINIVGCGMEGSDLVTTQTAPCGLDLRATDPNAKIYLQDKGQNIFRDLAIVDNNPMHDCTPFFYVTAMVVHFQNVSIKGTQSAPAACNDGFILGGNVGGVTIDCINSFNVPDCFGGYGSTFQNIFFSNTEHLFLLGTASNGSDFDYIFGDATNGHSTGGTPDVSAIEINASAANHSGSYPYGNTFKNLQIEQGNAGSHTWQYLYGLNISQNAGVNYVFSITCSDVNNPQQACVHIGSSSAGVSPQMVLGCYTTSIPVFQGCVQWDDLGSYPHIVADLYNRNPAFSVRNYYGANLGSTTAPFNYLRLAVGIDSPPNMTGIPNIDQFGGIVGFSNTAASPPPFGMNTYQLFSDGAFANNQFTVFPFETWLGQFTFFTSTNNGAAPIQIQPIYSVGTASQQTIPTVFSIPAGTSSGSLLTHAPPFSVSAENQISFQGVHAAPTGTTFATVRGFAANIMGRDSAVSGTAPSTVLGTYYNFALPGGSPTTYYTSFSQQTAWANTTENKAYTVVPFDYTPKGLCVYTSGTQGAGGNLVITLHQNGSGSSPVVTIPPGGTGGAWCDASGSFTGHAGDTLDLQLQNFDSGTGATIVSITLGITTSIPPPPALTPTGMLIFGMGGRSIVTNTYFALFGGGNYTSIAANAQVALPRAVTIKNLNCYLTLCPGVTATYRVYKNGGSTPLHVDIMTSGCPGNFPGTSDTVLFNPGDTIELYATQGAFSAPQVSSCTVEHD
jgi:hypothetical protein